MSPSTNLNPSTDSFPFPPKAVSTSATSSTSSWTGIDTHSHALASSIGGSPPNSATSIDSSGSPPDKRITAFGQGWLSTSSATPTTQSPAAASMLSSVFGSLPNIERTRSPSVPNLPSQYAQGRRVEQARQDAEHLSSLMRLAGVSSPAPNPYQGPLGEDEHQVETNLPGFVNDSMVSPPPITRYKSTPNLTAAQNRRNSAQQVRFMDDVVEGDEYPGSLGRKLGLKTTAGLVIPQGKNVYIASVEEGTTKEDIERYAANFGIVMSSRVQACEKEATAALTGPNSIYKSNQQRYCAFVLFEKPEQAADFIAHLRLTGQHCEYAKEDFQTEWKSRENKESSNLYIQGIPLDMEAETIARLFSRCGVVESLKIIETKGVRKGPVMVRMTHRREADAAIDMLNNQPINGSVLQVRIADSEEQKAFKRSQTFGQLPDSQDMRRTSMPVMSTHQREEEEELLQQIKLLKYHRQQAEVLEQQLLAASRRSGLALGPVGQSSIFPPSPLSPDIFPRMSRLPSGSSLRSVAPSFSTDRSVSITSSLSGFSDYHPVQHPPRGGVDYESLFAPTMTDGVTPRSATFGFNNAATAARAPITGQAAYGYGNALHHARSSPELGMNLGAMTKQSWPAAR